MDQQPAFEETQPVQETQPPFEETSDVSSGQPAFEETQPIEKYQTPLQQMGTVAEGAAQGLAGPLATAAELGLSKLGVPNMGAEDIAGRAAANPVEHGLAEAAGFIGGAFTGASEAGVATKIAERFSPEAVSILGKIGSTAINGAIQSMVFQGGNEITKGLLGQGDPNTPFSSAVANTGAAGLFGLGTGALLGASGQVIGGAAKVLQKAKLGQNVNDLLTGVGLASASTPEQIESFLSGQNTTWQKKGIKLYEVLHNKIVHGVAGGALAEALPFGNDTASERVLKDVAGSLIGSYAGPRVSDAVGKVLSPVILKMLGGGTPQGFENGINYSLKALQGGNKITQGINNLFDYGTSKAVDYANPGKNVEAIKKYIENGGVDSEMSQQPVPEQEQAFAKGGEVNPKTDNLGLAAHFPDQNVLVNAAKARVSNYLKSKKPSHMGSKLAFDTEHIDRNKERDYNHVVELADQPLGVLNHIKSGRLTSGQVQDLSMMYPELHGQLKKQLLEKVIDRVHKGEKPPYKIRQALSLFIGSDLDSSLTQPNMLAAQMTFVPKQNAPPQNKVSGLNKLAKTEQTASQGREARLNKG